MNRFKSYMRSTINRTSWGWDSGRDRTPIKNSEFSGLSCWVNDDAIIQRENTAGRASLARKIMSSVLPKS